MIKTSPDNEAKPTSRVFISRSDGGTLRQTYPERRPARIDFDSDDSLPYGEAKQIRKNADLVCVYGGSGGGHYGGRLKDKTPFDLSIADWGVHPGEDEFEERFALEAERIIGRGNLILIRY